MNSNIIKIGLLVLLFFGFRKKCVCESNDSNVIDEIDGTADMPFYNPYDNSNQVPKDYSQIINDAPFVPNQTFDLETYERANDSDILPVI